MKQIIVIQSCWWAVWVAGLGRSYNKGSNVRDAGAETLTSAPNRPIKDSVLWRSNAWQTQNVDGLSDQITEGGWPSDTEAVISFLQKSTVSVIWVCFLNSLSNTKPIHARQYTRLYMMFVWSNLPSKETKLCLHPWKIFSQWKRRKNFEIVSRPGLVVIGDYFSEWATL